MRVWQSIPSVDIKRFLLTVIVFVAVDLVFTAIAMGSARPNETIGTLRSVSTILPKLVQLAFVGLVVSVILLISRGVFNVELVLSGVVLTILLDIDHLPALLDIPQPIRPAHSFLFMAAVAFAIYIVLKKVDMSLVAVSSTMMHIAADSSSFPLLSPLTLNLYDISILGHLEFGAAAIFIALCSGYAAKRAAVFGSVAWRTKV